MGLILKSMPSAYFIAGTDTGIGKTMITAALVREFARRGLRSVGMKPVAAGCEQHGDALLSDDVMQLRAASNVAAQLNLINPYAFEPPIAPHIAAQQAGADIELDMIVQAFENLQQQADVVVVEGVGGFRVPLGATVDTADLAQILDIPVILVVGMRLGCISHALLTVEAIQARGLAMAGWVANRIDPDMAAFEENLAALQQRIPAPCLAVVPWNGEPDFSSLIP